MKSKYIVKVSKKTTKNLRKIPLDMQIKLGELIDDLENNGPFAHTWPNYRPLGNNKFHCHLNYSYVACWIWYKNTIEIEVDYVGSRENAPY
jgi:hypothetical protein